MHMNICGVCMYSFGLSCKRCPLHNTRLSLSFHLISLGISELMLLFCSRPLHCVRAAASFPNFVRPFPVCGMLVLLALTLLTLCPLSSFSSVTDCILSCCLLAPKHYKNPCLTGAHRAIQ